MKPRPPYHQQQILRRLPAWTRQLHPRHIERLLQSAHNEHIQSNGQPTEWFAQASALQQQLLREAIDARTTARKALGKALRGLQPLPQFCEPLLQRALAIEVPVSQAQYCFQPFKDRLGGTLETVPGLDNGVYEPQWISEPVGPPQRRSLLEAAMHNFEGMVEVGSFSTLQVSASDTTALPGMSMAQFVTACRRLDLGGRYQTHLDSLFNGPDKLQVRRAWIQAQRAMLTVQAVIAHIRGRLSGEGYQALRHLCIDGVVPRYGNAAVTLRSLTLLGKPIHGALLLGPVADKGDAIIAYLPFDQGNEVQEFGSPQQLSRYLAARLLDAQYRQRVVEQAAHKDQPALSHTLLSRLYEQDSEVHGVGGLLPLEPLWPSAGSSLYGDRATPSPDLGLRQWAVPQPYWNALYDAQVALLKDNARAVAVPTADIQAKVRQERLAFWENAGLNVLNVAAMLVPGLDAVMLLVFAAELLDNIYLAYEAWTEGDYAEAVEQLKALALTAGSVAVLGAAATLVKASGFVEWLERVVFDDKALLWHPQLEHYHSDVDLPHDLQPDREGLYPFEDRHYVRLDGKACQVEKTTDGDWALVHAQDSGAYRPLLRGNGRGAWRLEHERVKGWDRAKLLRRMGPVTDGQSDDDLAAAFDSTGLDQGALEPVLADGARVPPLLDDALLRLSKDLEADDIIARTREGRPLAAYKAFTISTLTELPGWPEDVVLNVYEGPEPWGDFTRYGREQYGDQIIEVTRSELDNGELARIILEHLDEASIGRLLPSNTAPNQRQQALQHLLADQLASKRQSMFDSLYRGQRPPLGETASTLARQFPSLPDEALEEIVDATTQAERDRLHSGRVPLRIAEEARVMQANLRLSRALIGLYRPSLANADTVLLRDGLQALHPQANDRQLFLEAIANRAQASRLIGQQPVRAGFRSPMRLSDGRYGYPLSPGAFASREEHELHALFPGLNDRERRQLLTDMYQRGDVATQIAAFQTELDTLRDGLEDWAAERPQQHQRHANALVGNLVRAWHRLEGDTLTLSNLELDSLPVLTTRFDHIRTVMLDNVALPEFPVEYLQSFPTMRNLRVQSSPDLNLPSLFAALRHAPHLSELSIDGCNLAQLPATAHETLPTLSGLRFLSLRRNGLALNENDLALLTGRRRLLALDLYRNRITLTEPMAQRFGALRALRVLNLGNNPLGISPHIGNLRTLSELNLENCELNQWPGGLEILMGAPLTQPAGIIDALTNSRHLFALRRLNLSRNQIAQIPDLNRLTTRPFVRALRTPGADQQWQLNYNPVPEATRQRLEAAGVSVEAPWREELPEHDPRPRGWMRPTNPQQDALWENLFADGANSSLRDAIDQAGLSLAAQMRTQALSEEIWDLLEDAADNEALRTQLDELAQEFPVTCGDSGADALGTLQIEAQVFRIGAGNPRATPTLFRYFRRLYRREQVNDLAQALYYGRLQRRNGLLAIRQWEALPASQRGPRPSVDDLLGFDQIEDAQLLDSLGLDMIEIRLGLRTNLEHALDFPEPQLDMRYRHLAIISQSTEDAVMAQVLQRDEDLVARRTWVSRHPIWRRLLRAQYPERFNALRARWDSGLEYLDWCNDDSPSADDMTDSLEPTVSDALASALGESPLEVDVPRRLELNSAQYTSGMTRMALGLEDDENALFLELTQPLDSDH